MIQRKRFWEIKYFGLRTFPTHATTLQQVGILSTLVYFHPKGCFGYISSLMSCLVWVKTTLIAIMRPVYGRFYVLICGCV